MKSGTGRGMNWYYLDNGQQIGPVDETEFQEAIRAGKIIHNTPVKNESLKKWQEYSTIVRFHMDALEKEKCSRCGEGFFADDLIRYKGKIICASCKAKVLQDLKGS
jgi:formylmethanofuran dehydrogenase subunit E